MRERTARLANYSGGTLAALDLLADLASSGFTICRELRGTGQLKPPQ